MTQGTVKFFNSEKGFGFISRAGRRRVRPLLGDPKRWLQVARGGSTSRVRGWQRPEGPRSPKRAPDLTRQLVRAAACQEITGRPRFACSQNSKWPSKSWRTHKTYGDGSPRMIRPAETARPPHTRNYLSLIVGTAQCRGDTREEFGLPRIEVLEPQVAAVIRVVQLPQQLHRLATVLSSVTVEAFAFSIFVARSARRSRLAAFALASPARGLAYRKLFVALRWSLLLGPSSVGNDRSPCSRHKPPHGRAQPRPELSSTRYTPNRCLTSSDLFERRRRSPTRDPITDQR